MMFMVSEFIPWWPGQNITATDTQEAEIFHFKVEMKQRAQQGLGTRNNIRGMPQRPASVRQGLSMQCNPGSSIRSALLDLRYGWQMEALSTEYSFSKFTHHK